METIKTILRPVLDLTATGNKIRLLRKQNGFSVHELQGVFGFEFPQAIYAWETGKNAPSLDNLLVLSRLFKVSIEELIEVRIVEVEAQCSQHAADCMNQDEKACETCSFRKSA